MSAQLRAFAPIGLLLLVGLFGCGPEKPPAPDDRRASQRDAIEVDDPFFSPETDDVIITYAGEKGEFSDCKTVADVPETARARVGINVFGKPAPPGKVWITDLTAPEPDGRYALASIPRDEFETEVLGTGRASAFELPGDLDVTDIAPPGDGPVIVYKTSWCGVCKQVEAYLDKKGVAYVAKDIEQDRAAAAELQAKAKAKGVPTGSVPMIDVGGELLRGFDRARLDKLL